MSTGKVDYQEFKEKTRGSVIWDRLNPLRYTQTISLARAQLITDAYKEYEGYSFYRKRGFAIAKILKEVPIRIEDDQLLVGDYCAKPMGPEWYPDLAAAWVADYVDKYGWKGSGKFYAFENEAEAQQAKEISHYWRNIGGKEMWLKFIGPEQAAFEHKVSEANAWISNTISEMYAEKAWNVPDIARIVTKGVRGLVADIDARLETLEIITDDDYRAHEFLIGLKTMLLAGIDYAHRYAALAREKAAAETNPKRKSELEEIARVCDRVPEFPAETFQDALQSFQFGILMVYWDTRTYGMGFGRVDQFLYPTFKADMESGKIDTEYATQLLECFRVITMGKRQFWPDVMVPNVSAESHFHNCVIGGVDPVFGHDATNELSFLWLEAAARVRTTHPTLSIRWHPRLNRKFMKRALEVVAMGMGFPAFFNDDASIMYLLARGYTLEEARDYAIGGCVLHHVPGKQSSVWPLVTNYGKILELTLRNGFDWRTQEQLGPETGDFLKMKDYDEFMKAFEAQSVYWAKFAAHGSNACRIQHIESFPDIMMSAFTDDCIKRGKVTSLGGAVHNDCVQYIVPVGVQDVANDLYVLKNAIFCDNPVCSREELLDALAKNWEGHEELRAKMLAMPKFGNDIPEVDNLLNDIYLMLKKIWFTLPGAYGGHFEVAPHSIGFHAGCGAKCGALPSGREAFVAMADGGVSPVQSTDVNGPTAVINSAGRIDQIDLHGVLFNMRFTPAALSTPEGRDHLAALIKTYFEDYKGKHIQFNVMSRAQMIAAKEEPEKYRDLIVRVAGYSAYWTDLSEVTQNELISRSELDFAS